VVGQATQTEGMFMASLRTYCEKNKVSLDIAQLLEEAFSGDTHT